MSNFFSNNSSDMPDIKLRGLPKLKALPKITLNNDDVLFDGLDGSILSIDDLAKQISDTYYTA